MATPQSQAAWVEKAYAVPSRPGVEQVFVVSVEKSLTDAKAVKNMVVMFAGGAGAIASPAAGTSEQAPGNLKSLHGYLAEKLGVAVSIGLPSDQQQGLSLDWRETAEHEQDVSAVTEVLMKQYPEARITVLGFSNGGRSAAHIGAGLGRKWGARMQGVVLMSTSPEAFRRDWIQALEASRDGQNIKRKVPVLVVHHKRDSCLPYREIESDAKWHDLILVDDAKQPRVDAFRRDCGHGSAHQFSGRQDWVYQAVVDWIKTGKVTELSN
ncbi:MAG: hypothetical protein ABI790_12335 [Betaproteobacteria bacterium]